MSSTLHTAVLPSVRAQAERLLALGVHELSSGLAQPLYALAGSGDVVEGGSLLPCTPTSCRCPS